jgi:hypothetical protein
VVHAACAEVRLVIAPVTYGHSVRMVSLCTSSCQLHSHSHGACSTGKTKLLRHEAPYLVSARSLVLLVHVNVYISEAMHVYQAQAKGVKLQVLHSSNTDAHEATSE